MNDLLCSFLRNVTSGMKMKLEGNLSIEQQNQITFLFLFFNGRRVTMCFSLISSTRYLSPCLNSAYIGPLSALFSGIVPLYDAMSSRYTCHQTLKTFCEPLASPLTGQWYLIEGHWCLLTCCLGGGGGIVHALVTTAPSKMWFHADHDFIDV